MRTVSFSNPEVADAINNHFVAMNTNIEGDPTAGASLQHAPADQPGSCIRGNGRQNVQTIFMTPDLKVFHVATGFLGPEDLFEEMRFAANLFTELNSDADNRFDLVRNAHRTRLQDLGFEDREIDAQSEMDLMRDMMQNGGNFPSMSSSNFRTGNDSDRPAGPSTAFAPFIRTNVLKDHRFSIKHPLMPIGQLENDPGELVGRGKTFFSSSSNQSNSGR